MFFFFFAAVSHIHAPSHCVRGEGGGEQSRRRGAASSHAQSPGVIRHLWAMEVRGVGQMFVLLSASGI